MTFLKYLLKKYYLLAFVGGALIPLSLAPFHIWPLGILGVVLLVTALQPLRPKQSLLAGWLFGVGLFGVGTSWVYVSIHTYGAAPVPLAVFLTLLFVAGLALFTVLQCYLFVRFLKHRTLGLILGFPALWVLSEWLRSWFLAGFPWLFLGYAHEQTWLSSWAPILGVYGVSFMVALSGVVIYLGARLSSRVRVILSVILIIPWILGLLLQQINWVTHRDQPLSVSLVQGNIPQEMKWNPEHLKDSMEKYQQLTSPYWQHDVIVWPEAAIPFWADEVPEFLQGADQFTKQHNTTFISGIPYREQTNEGMHYYNSAIALGAGSGIYHKERLVPFGEYVPLDSVLRGLIQFFDLPMSNFTRGNNSTPFLTMRGDIHIAPFICYEIVYPDFVNATLPEADMLLTISNDTWFGSSFGPFQHLQIAQMRALENGRYLLRATNNGISAIVDEKGRLVKTSTQFKEEVLNGEVYVMKGNTPFGKTGSWPILILSVLLVAVAVFFKRKQ
jgi:apolipoprotein N-acyltransferase